LPVGTVTESNPAHRLAYWRFSSEQVKRFNQLQVDILRAHSPGRDIVHNFMGNFVEFDHFDVAADLDVASWDNYPLGFLTRDGTNKADQQAWLRTGHPDSSAFHHDLYRACGRGRMWLMEQQPGPVNWAPYNPAPLPGMVRLWGWEAFAHGAELVSYFRYRQAQAAQEQMHTALCLSNGDEDDAAAEVKMLSEEVQLLMEVPHEHQAADVAMVFDYAGDQAARIQQPDGQHYDPLVFIQSVYSAVRQLGMQVDFVSSNSSLNNYKLNNYKLIIVANSTVSDQILVDKLAATNAHIVLFPRTGSKTSACSIPDTLPPGAFQTLLDIKITRTESLPADLELITDKKHRMVDWRERVDSALIANDSFDDGWGFHYQHNKVHYFNACPSRETLLTLIEERLTDAGLKPVFRAPGLSAGTGISGCGRCYGMEGTPVNERIRIRKFFSIDTRARHSCDEFPCNRYKSNYSLALQAQQSISLWSSSFGIPLIRSRNGQGRRQQPINRCHVVHFARHHIINHSHWRI